MRDHLRRLAEQGVRVAVFPECALTGYFEDVVKSTSTEWNARKSLSRGPLTGWWEEGLNRFRVIEEGPPAPTEARR